LGGFLRKVLDFTLKIVYNKN
jgi:hypothetical protein